MGELLDEFEIKLKDVLALRADTYLSENEKTEQEDYLWVVIQKIWKGMGPIETYFSKEVLDRLFPQEQIQIIRSHIEK